MREDGDARVLHVALRVPRVTKIDDTSFNTVESHNAVVKKKGRVAVAKFGDPISKKGIAQLREQLSDGAKTLLVLGARSGLRTKGQYIGFQSEISSIHEGPADVSILSIIPAYYQIGRAHV